MGRLVDTLREGREALDGVGHGSVLARRYRLEDRQQAGPDGSVWRAVDETLERQVSVRVLAPNHPHAADVIDAARRAALVEDPRLTRVLDVGNAGVTYIVSEHVQGRLLADLLAVHPLPAETVRRIVGEAAQAIDRAGSRGLHHQRLTPSSIVIQPDGSIKILGTAIEAAMLGIEPENADAAKRADAVGLVSIVYAGLTGRWPGIADGPLGPAPRVTGRAVPPGELVAGVPNDLDTLCTVTLGPNEDGPRTPAELAEQLSPWARVEPLTDPRGLTMTGPIRPTAEPARTAASSVAATPHDGVPLATGRPDGGRQEVDLRGQPGRGGAAALAPAAALGNPTAPAAPPVTTPSATAAAAAAASSVPAWALGGGRAAVATAEAPARTPRSSLAGTDTRDDTDDVATQNTVDADGTLDAGTLDAGTIDAGTTDTGVPGGTDAAAGTVSEPSTSAGDGGAGDEQGDDAQPGNADEDDAHGGVGAVDAGPAGPADEPSAQPATAEPPRTAEISLAGIAERAAAQSPWAPPAPSEPARPVAAQADPQHAEPTSGPYADPFGEADEKTIGFTGNGLPAAPWAQSSAASAPPVAAPDTPPSLQLPAGGYGHDRQAPSTQAPSTPQPTTQAPSSPWSDPQQGGLFAGPRVRDLDATGDAWPTPAPAARVTTTPTTGTPFGGDLANELMGRDSAPGVHRLEPAPPPPLGGGGPNSWSGDWGVLGGEDRLGPFMPPVPLARPPKQQTQLVIIVLAALVVLGLILAVISLRGLFSAPTLVPSPSTSPGAAASAPATSTAPSSAASTATTAGTGTPVEIAGVKAIDPQGDGSEYGASAARVLDEDPTTFWRSERYATPDFSGAKAGVGLVLDLGSSQTVSAVTIQFRGTGGAVELRQAADPAFEDSTVVASGAMNGGTLTLNPVKPVTTRYLVLWFTRLTLQTNGENRLLVSEVSVR